MLLGNLKFIMVFFAFVGHLKVIMVFFAFEYKKDES